MIQRNSYEFLEFLGIVRINLGIDKLACCLRLLAGSPGPEDSGH